MTGRASWATESSLLHSQETLYQGSPNAATSNPPAHETRTPYNMP